MKMHGGDIYGAAAQLGISIDKCLDFSANINPLGVPERVRDAMEESLSQISYYPDPDCSDLIRILAAQYHLPENWFLIGNGAADLIYRLVYALNPRRGLVVAPTFLEYEEAMKQTGTEISVCPLDDSLEVKEDLLNWMGTDLDLLFLCNPNNPTGGLVAPELLRRILDRAYKNQTIVVLDECFLDYTGREQTDSVVSQLELYPNVLVLKSFTKMFAIPGIRLGYGISSNLCLLEKIKRAGQTWPVNRVAMAAGIAAIQEKEFIRESTAYIKEQREFLRRGLIKLGMSVCPGTANYLLFQAAGCRDLYEKLLPFYIIVRRCFNYSGLDETWYRIAVRSQKENQILLEALEKIRSKSSS